jgi:hypothetical protein
MLLAIAVCSNVPKPRVCVLSGLWTLSSEGSAHTYVGGRGGGLSLGPSPLIPATSVEGSTVREHGGNPEEGCTSYGCLQSKKVIP